MNTRVRVVVRSDPLDGVVGIIVSGFNLFCPTDNLGTSYSPPVKYKLISLKFQHGN
jgi:hypothetical protein